MPAQTQSQTLHFQIVSQNILSPEEKELYELSQLAGVVLDPPVFKIIMDMLRMNISPSAIHEMLKSMTGNKGRKKLPSGEATAKTEKFTEPRGRSVEVSSSRIKLPEPGSLRARSNSKGRLPSGQR